MKRLIGILVVLFAVEASAQNMQRTFVSAANGSDSNPCTPTQPCRNFTAAIARTSPQGEVIALDSGGYGPITINKAVSLRAPQGIYAGIATGTGPAINIAVGATDIVTIQGLTINGLGTAETGINFTSGLMLNVDRVQIENFSRQGLKFTTETESDLNVTSTLFLNNGFGFTGGMISGAAVVNGGTAGTLRGLFHDSRFTRNGNVIGYPALAVGNRANVTVSECVANENFRAYQASGAESRLTVESSVAANGVVGIAGGANAIIYVANSAITGNILFGLEAQSGSQILTRGNNTLVGNAGNEAFSGTFASK